MLHWVGDKGSKDNSPHQEKSSAKTNIEFILFSVDSLPFFMKSMAARTSLSLAGAEVELRYRLRI